MVGVVDHHRLVVAVEVLETEYLEVLRQERELELVHHCNFALEVVWASVQRGLVLGGMVDCLRSVLVAMAELQVEHQSVDLAGKGRGDLGALV